MTGSAKNPGRTHVECGLACHLIEKQTLIIGGRGDRGAQCRNLVPPPPENRDPQLAKASVRP
jgi:hypothetical protein